MKTRIYTREWFYNAGIIGFLRILKHNQKEFAKIEENYIEFEANELKEFHHYYFKYFFDTYNVAEKTKERIEKSFSKIEKLLGEIKEDSKENKEILSKIKSEKKYIKTIIKSQLDKIKKINENVYNTVLEQYEKIDTANNKEELQEIQEIIINEVKKDEINKKITMNLFKNILSKNYFGQPSFLNVLKTALSYEEQQDVMYKDYISNIIETDFLQKIVNGIYSIEQVKEHIENQNFDLLTKEILQIYSNITKKYIEKDKSIEDIQEYIQEKVFSSCYMCENEYTITGNYSESNFAPLAISSDNMKNFFWNQNAEFPVCDLCKLILFCIPAGITTISKIVKEQGQTIYREKEMLSFVNYDTDIQTLLKTNNFFAIKSKKDKNIENPLNDLILNIVEQDSKISRWQLENIFVIEFETEYGAYSRMQYFNIKRHVANFFILYGNSMLNTIKERNYKLQIIDYILKDKDIKYVINDKLKEELSKDNSFGFNSYMATKIRMTLKLLKKEENMEAEVKKNNAKISVLYNLGIEIHEKLKAKKEENKLNGYTYKMLNSIKTGNRQELMDTILRIHLSMNKDVSPIFIEIMKDSDLDFEAIGHSFLAGLISNRREDENNKEVTNNE
ncbi:MAG: type I-B CRISPR-associated protein Cas8b1/Cst1 [Clostridia bacterium]|nr:type I-B CRISPR-associated protein Cas8b1/Cst1 [Clostridia bacterium]